MSSLSIADGEQWLKNKYRKIENLFSGKEGFGILGPNASVDGMNASELLSTTDLTRTFNTGITQNSTVNTALNAKRTSYLGSPASYSKNRNYNLYINSNFKNVSDITATPDAVGCVSIDTITGTGGLIDTGAAWLTAYPVTGTQGNFASVADATNACKLWAADASHNTFAITKNANKNYKCYTGSNLSTAKKAYTHKTVVLNLANDISATRGGLFADGTIGIYNSQNNSSGTDPYNKKFLLNGPIKITGCDTWNGGGVNSSSIRASYGVNCSNITNPPLNVRYISIIGNGRDVIQIAQLAVFGFVNGVSQNLARLPSVTTTVLSTFERYGDPHKNKAIDGVLQARVFPNIYHSNGTGSSEFWRLDLLQDYPVYKVVYYNRIDCCSQRAKGMTIILAGVGTEKKYTLNEQLVQSFDVTA